MAVEILSGLMVIVFLALFFLLNFYVFVRLRNVFGLVRPVRMRWVAAAVFIVLVGVITLLSIFGRSRLSIVIIPTWIAGLVYLVIGFGIVGLLARYCGVDRVRADRAAVVVVAFLVVYGVYNSFEFDVNEVVIPLDGISEMVAFVQLSDVHIGDVRGKDYLERLVEEVNDIDADFVVITGDFFDGSDNVDEDTVAPLMDIDVPVFFSMGNHEGYFGMERAQELLEGAGVRVLRNEVVLYDGLQIAGTDFSGHMFSSSNPYVGGIGIDESMPAILLFHSPVGVDDARAAGVDLQLSGHTHGGQIFPFSLVTQQVYPVFKGLYEFDGMYVYVSQGCGTFGPPMRIGTDSEIALIRLVSA